MERTRGRAQLGSKSFRIGYVITRLWRRCPDGALLASAGPHPRRGGLRLGVSNHFDCAEPHASAYADLVARAGHEITLSGSPIDPAAAYADGRIALTGLAAAHNELRVVADCAYGTCGAGLQRSVDSADGRVYTFTDFDPRTRGWPCQTAGAAKTLATVDFPLCRAAVQVYESCHLRHATFAS